MLFIPTLSVLLALGTARATRIQGARAHNLATNSSSGLTGDSKCVELMCISATVFPNSTTQYTLTSSGSSALGWIAMGFGATMANSPMVIVWPNSDGSVTLSQRMAPAEVMPTVVSSPPRVASLDMGLSSFASTGAGSKPSFVYTVSSISPNPSAQPVIWALASVPPSGAAPDATLVQHVDSGTFTLDLTLPIASNSTTPPTTSAGGSGDDAEHKRNMMILNHGILCTIGFLGLLPLGVLVARWTRAFTTRWFAGHAVIQAVLSGPIIVAGVALGIHSVDESMGMHLDDTHKQLGVALFVLYFVQLLGGAVIHFFKPKSSTSSPRRPAQNYAHAVLGLLILALAFWQVRTGYRREYPEWATGRVPIGVNTLWIVWVVLIPVAYVAGLALVPRQFRQEAAARGGAGKREVGGGGVDPGSADPGAEMREGGGSA